MRKQWLLPQLQKGKADFILQQNEAPANFFGNVHDYLISAELPVRWIERASGDDISFFCGLHAHLT